MSLARRSSATTETIADLRCSGITKLTVNQAYENMGLASTQLLGPILDGLMRNTPDAHEFIDVAARQGVRTVLERRDGPFGDYGQAPPDRRPDPLHVIEP